MKLAVVVGTYNRLPQLQQCIESIVAQTRSPMRVYVTDAGSTDGTVEYLQSIASETVEPLLIGKRLGQARAYNEVFAQIDTPYVCWLSDDNVIVNRGLDVAVQVLDENSQIGMIALKVQDKLGPFVDAPYIGGVSAIGVLNVNQGMLRTSILKQVGGFSERFRDYGIDPDLTAKVLFSGYSIAYTRAVAIHHYRNWGVDFGSEEYTKQMEKQKVYLALYQKKYGEIVSPSLFWAVKKWIWQTVRDSLKVRMNSTRSFLGFIARDWHNIFTSRYISVLSSLTVRQRAYYLVQYCPPHQRPKTLPPDPEG